MYKTVLATFSLINCIGLAFVPNELPTLLSIVYSNIPPVKLGADSKFGIGFRIGRHADFQTLIEIGPQENTQPVGIPDGSQLKRQSSKTSLLNNNNSAIEEQKILPQKNHEVKKKQIPRNYNRTTVKKNSRPQIGKIEFKKVPGIDDVRSNKNKKMKAVKFSTDAAPTRFVIL